MNSKGTVLEQKTRFLGRNKLSKTLPKMFEACTMHNTRLKCPHTGALGRLGHICKVLIECRMLSKLNFQKLISDKCE